MTKEDGYYTCVSEEGIQLYVAHKTPNGVFKHTFVVEKSSEEEIEEFLGTLRHTHRLSRN